MSGSVPLDVAKPVTVINCLQTESSGAAKCQFTDSANARRARELQRFYGSGVHNDYGFYNVAPGVTAPEWLHGYLIHQAG